MSTYAFYYRFAPPGARPGTMTVRLSRAAACGSFAPSPITIRLSRLRIDVHRQPTGGRLLAARHVLLRSNPCDTRTVSFHVRPPFRVDVSTPKTFVAPDGRQLSAQVTFAFAPS
jgi:hypothetical protein